LLTPDRARELGRGDRKNKRPLSDNPISVSSPRLRFPGPAGMPRARHAGRALSCRSVRSGRPRGVQSYRLTAAVSHSFAAAADLSAWAEHAELSQGPSTPITFECLAMAQDPLRGPPAALRLLVDGGVPARLRLIGSSMEPTLRRGATLWIAALEVSAVLDAGDVVVIAAAGGQEVIVHRVLQTFVEGGRDFIVHQGDAPGTTFAVAARPQVLARVTAVDADTSQLPCPIGSGDRGRFTARRLASRGYLVARRLGRFVGVPSPSALRRLREGFRSIVGSWVDIPGLEVALTLRLDLPALSAPDDTPAISICEISRSRLEEIFESLPALARAPGNADRVAPHGWRCFVAEIDGRPAHISFVETRPGRPLLFGALTEPALRGRGLFRATVRFIAALLESEGAPALWSSVAGNNRPSVRAHRAAGFSVERRSVDVVVGAIRVRALARRILRGE
jgi:hypothetical protein